jgi:hypothetical protein
MSSNTTYLFIFGTYSENQCKKNHMKSKDHMHFDLFYETTLLHYQPAMVFISISNSSDKYFLIYSDLIHHAQPLTSVINKIFGFLLGSSISIRFSFHLSIYGLGFPILEPFFF